MPLNNSAKAEIYTRYPLSSLLIYNVVTVLHFVLGGIGIMIGYSFSSWVGYVLGSLYLLFAFVQICVIMPLKVCPNCVYYPTENSLCTSGLNVVSRKVSKEGSTDDFPKRASGLLCHNNLYMAALIIPGILMLPALVVSFSWLLVVIFLAVVGLLLFRFFVIFSKVACLHCSAKYVCPNAERSGVRDR